MIDLAIPRGGESLIRRVSEEARMPVIKHFTGNCHVYVDRSADLDMAERIIVNCQVPAAGRLQRGRVAAGPRRRGRRAAAADRQGPDRARRRDPRRRPHDRAPARGQAGQRSRTTSTEYLGR